MEVTTYFKGRASTFNKALKQIEAQKTFNSLQTTAVNQPISTLRFKKITFGVLISISMLAVWYFLIKPYDYQVTFSAKMPIAGAFHYLANYTSRAPDFKRTTLVKDDIVHFSKLTFEIPLANEDNCKAIWYLEALSDTTTHFTVHAKAASGTIYHRWQALRFKSELARQFTAYVRTVAHSIRLHASRFEVQLPTADSLPPIHYVYVSLQGYLEQKAAEMMKADGMLTHYIQQNNLQVNGKPLTRVMQWDQQNNKVVFHYGFPIKAPNSPPPHPSIKVGHLPASKALRSTYFGNYAYSHQAWHILRAYTQRKGYQVSTLPIEVFYDTPHLGGDDRQWRAHAFLPVP